MNETAWLIMQDEVGKGERLLWSGQPRQGVRFRAGDTIAIPFSLLWGGFAILWETMVLRATFSNPEGKPFVLTLLFPLFGIPFVCMGLYVIFGRFIVDSKARAKTYYGVTDKRVIIISGLINRQLKSIDIKTLSEVSLTEKGDGSGTVTLGSPVSSGSPFGRGAGNFMWPGTAGRLVPSLDMIDNARVVYDMIREAQTRA